MNGGFVKPDKLRILGRRLLGGQQAFILNNIMRIREMIRYGSPGLKNVFQAIPYFLQVNNSKTPGYIPVDNPPRGIFGFERSGFARSFRETHPDKSLREILAPSPCIQSLSLIGSTGSVGHTAISDLDYWVCVDKKDLDSDAWTLMEMKLKDIAKWAREKRRTEVTFFLMDIDDLRSNRLGGLDEESSGNVMPRLLKEEFYRTLLHVAGRIPLWWVAPSGTSPENYRFLSEHLERIQSTTLHPLDFVDLGYPETPDPREFLGAAMWQAYKSQRDPFKAVLKMILIKEQLDNKGTPLLCDQVKAALNDTPPDELPVDPYVMTIKRVLGYTEERLPQSLELVRICSWFKLQTPFEPQKLKKEDKKRQLLNKLIVEWGWDEKHVSDLDNYRNWSVKRRLDLGEEIKSFLLDLYSTIAAKLRSEHPDQVRVEDDSLTRLNAQLLARYASHGAKVEDLPSGFNRQGLPTAFNFGIQDGLWRIYDPTGKERDFIYAAPRAVRLAAWLVHNRIWRQGFKLLQRTGDATMKASALTALSELLEKTFPPIKINSYPEQNLLPKPEGPKVLVINMEEPSLPDVVLTAELVYRTNLGEMCHEVLQVDRTVPETEKYLIISEYLMKHDEQGLRRLEVFVPPGRHQKELADKLVLVFHQMLASQTSMGGSSRSRLKLDLDEQGPARRRPPRSKLKLDLD